RDASGQVSRISASNTDAPALAASLSSALGDLSGKQIAILGAGGAAKAAAYALARAGAHITIYNRSRPRPDSLTAALQALSLQVTAADLASFPITPPAACLNCTSLPLHAGPRPSASPCPSPTLPPRPRPPIPPRPLRVDHPLLRSRLPLHPHRARPRRR